MEEGFIYLVSSTIPLNSGILLTICEVSSQVCHFNFSYIEGDFHIGMASRCWPKQRLALNEKVMRTL